MNMPTVFVSHGAPTLLFDPVPTRDFLKSLGRQIERPRAILCVSAHWETPRPMVSGASRPETIYDFYGFPEPLYRVQYPAPGDPDLARRIVELLTAAGLPAGIHPSRGLDHGAWAPLMLMYPDAAAPVVQLSVQSQLGAKHHLTVGRALQPLRKEGVLILGSGGATHNLREFHGKLIDAPPLDYALAFDDWLRLNVIDGNEEALTGYLKEAPQAARNHPTPEHFLPLFAPLGAAGVGARGRVLHQAFTFAILSMTAFAWD